jgi:hypothetical protein
VNERNDVLAIIAGEQLELKEWGLGHGPMPRDWETWDDHGRRRDRCRYCNGRHDFNDCEDEGDVKPGKGLIGPWFLAETGEKYFVTLQMEAR